MSSDPLIPSKKKKEEVTPGWDKELYAPERIQKWVNGEITMAELNAVSGPEMLEMAVSGFSLYETGKYKDAQLIFEGLCILDPSEGYYRTALGAIHLAQENLDQAEQCFNRAIELNDKEIASFVNRGEVYLRQGKLLEAAQDFKRAVDLDPQGKDPLSTRARVLAAAALETLEGGSAAKAEASKPAASAQKK